jgi:hypothetical protein
LRSLDRKIALPASNIPVSGTARRLKVAAAAPLVLLKLPASY